MVSDFARGRALLKEEHHGLYPAPWKVPPGQSGTVWRLQLSSSSLRSLTDALSVFERKRTLDDDAAAPVRLEKHAVRRLRVAHSMGFDEQRRSDISIVATELANNVLLHGLSGELLICPTEADHGWLDIMALDKGPGIQDVSRAFEDGVSSIGTAGQGLGAVKRLSDEVSLHSNPGGGTVVFCRFNLSEASKAVPLGVVNIPIHGEVRCGDSYLALPGASRSLFMVVDGLGHGAIASEAANEAVKAVQEASQESLSEIMMTTHNALKTTRGAAMSIAIVDHERLVVNYAGVGNVNAAIGSGTSTRGMISRNGTLGAIFPKVQEYTLRNRR